MSLHKKMMVVFTLAITFTFFSLILLLQFYIRPLNTRRIENNTVQLMQARASELGSWLNQRISELRIIHQFPGCQTMDFEQIKPYLAQLNEVLKEQYGNPEETFAVGGLDGRGWVNDNLTIDVSARPYFREAVTTNKEYVISQPVVSKSDRNAIFLICYPIRGESGETIGFINGSVNLARFSEITDSIDVYGGLVWLMNREGSLYTVSRESELSQELSAQDLQSIARRADSQEAGCLYQTVQSGRQTALFYSSVPYADDWILCAMVENSRIHAATTQMIHILALACLALLLAAVLFTSLLSASVLRPIGQLQKNMAQVAEGNLDSFYKGFGNDEISVLGRSFNQMLIELKRLIDQLMKEQQQKRQAELRALQSQINPHFLYNTLDTIQWKALEYQAMDIAEMIQLLSQLFRLSLNNGKEIVTVAEELAHVRNYLAIQKIRYGDAVSYALEAEPSVTRCRIPKLILQPLVENAIYHGIKPAGRPGKIEIRLWAEETSLCLQVADNGAGMTPQALKEVRRNLALSLETDHYGLYNVNERLRLRYGNACRLHVKSETGKGTCVSLQLPLAETPADNPLIS